MRDPVTLLICDDHKILTDALSLVVGHDPELRLVAPATHDGARAVELCREHRPNVVLMDVEFKVGMSGIEATRLIKEASPATKVVIMTAHDDEHVLVDAVEAGASGFLGKDLPADEVLAAAKAAAEGEAWEVLRHLAQGRRNDDIAASLSISPQTVQTHVRNALGKLGVHSKLEAVALAVRGGQIEV